jgi:hypothetical protein
MSDLRIRYCYPIKQNPERQPEVKRNRYFYGQKNEVLKLSAFTSNNNNAMRYSLVFQEVTVWENEGSGIQIMWC